jgi:transcriptional regulator with XRE-family HTH domain
MLTMQAHSLRLQERLDGMMLHATFEPRKPGEKRAAARKRLRLVAPGLRAGGETGEVLVRDLSATGMLLESAEPLAEGESLAIELPRSGSHDARVVWSSGELYGFRFARPLSPAALSAALLRASPPDAAEREEHAPGIHPFPERMATLREERGWSVEQLARRLGVSRQSVWYWECGRRHPKPGMMRRIENIFGLGERGLSQPLSDRADIGELQQWKARIAEGLGVAPDKVKILIEL